MRPLLPVLLLFAAAQAQAVASGPWYEVSKGSWRVKARMVTDMRRSIEATGREAARTAINQRNQWPRSIAADTVQYQGTHDAKTGRRLIQVYGMCQTDKSPAALRDFWAVVYDGGNCYFWAKFDPAARKFVSFEFNESP